MYFFIESFFFFWYFLFHLLYSHLASILYLFFLVFYFFSLLCISTSPPLCSLPVCLPLPYISSSLSIAFSLHSLTVILFLPSSVFKTLFLHPVPCCDHFTSPVPFLVSCVYYYLYSLVPRVIILTVFSTPPPSPFSGIYVNSQGHSVSKIFSFPSPFLLSADWACLTMTVKILGLSCPFSMSGE